MKRTHSFQAAIAVLAFASSMTLGAFAQKHHTKAKSTTATETRSSRGGSRSLRRSPSTWTCISA